MARNKSTKPTGAELRALRDQRATEGPYAAQEAARRERSFLSRLTGAKEDFDWILSNEAWTHLGFPSFTAWYVARVQPTIEALGARPAPELANEVLERIREDEAALPPAQRRTKAELAALTGLSEWKVRDRQDRPNRRNAAATDLDKTSAGSTEAAAAGVTAAGSETVSSDPGDAGTSAAGVSTQTSGDQESKDAPVEDTPAGRIPSSEVPPQDGQPGLETPAATVATPVPDADREQEESGEGASSPDNQNPFIDWVHDLVDVVGQRIDVEDGFTTDEDLKLLLRNAVADLQDHLGELEFVWMRDLAGEVPALSPAVMGAGTEQGGA